MCSDFVALVKRIPGLEVDEAIANLGGSADLYEKMFRLVLRIIPQNAAQMDENLYTQGDLEAFAIKVHGTKGSLNQIGNKKLGKYAEMLEKASKAGDKQYCADHYGDFKTQVLLFCSQVEAVILKDGLLEENGRDAAAPTDNIGDFSDNIAEAKEAVEDFDSMGALEILSPLAKRRFGGETDKLLAAAVEALEMFNLQQALEYISKLQEE